MSRSIPLLSGNTACSSTSEDDNTNNVTNDKLHQHNTTSSSSYSSSNGDLRIVERLPSRNISFQSAEILTLEELSQSLFLASSKRSRLSSCEGNNNIDADNDSSHDEDDGIKCIFREKPLEYVRVTGVVLDMVIMESNNSASGISGGDSSCAGGGRKSFLILGDPLFVPTPNPSLTRAASSRSSSNSCLLSTPRQRNGSIQNDALTTTLTKSSSQYSVGTTLSGQKRRLITVKPRTHNSLLLNKQQHLQSQKSNKIQRIVTSLNSDKVMQEGTMTIQQRQRRKQNESLIRKSRQGMHMVIVDVTNMASVDGCKADDLVMVIGMIAFETIPSLSSSSLDDVNGDNNDEFIQVARLLMKHEQHKQQQQKQQQRVFGYVQSRIVRVVNGLDMNLFREALLLKRERLLYFERPS